MRTINTLWFTTKIQELEKQLGSTASNIQQELQDYAPIQQDEIEDLDFNLPKDVYQKEMDAWNIAKKQYKELRNKRVLELFNQLIDKELVVEDKESLGQLVRPYLSYSGVQMNREVALVIRDCVGIGIVIRQLIEATQEEHIDSSYDAIKHLENFKFSDQQWKNLDLEKYIPFLAQNLKACFNRTDYYSDPSFYILNIVERLSPSYAEDLAILAPGIINACDPTILRHREVEANLLTMKNCFDHLRPYWSSEEIKQFCTMLISTAKVELKPDDWWVHQHLLGTLEVVGKDSDEAQKCIQWIRDTYAAMKA